jgi:hypothetical protein
MLLRLVEAVIDCFLKFLKDFKAEKGEIIWRK